MRKVENAGIDYKTLQENLREEQKMLRIEGRWKFTWGTKAEFQEVLSVREHGEGGKWRIQGEKQQQKFLFECA